MLIEFRAENHRSLRDEQVLSMEAGRVGDGEDGRARKVAGHSKGLLPVAVLYGANASGKSNVLDAFQFMREAVLISQTSWPPNEGVPRDPFAWGPKRAEPSLFEVSLLLDGVRFRYGFTASDERFLKEWLHCWPNGKKQVLFERDLDQFRFGTNLKGENKVIKGLTRTNALFLSAAVQFRHEQLEPIYNWFEMSEVQNLRKKRRTYFNGLGSKSVLSPILGDEFLLPIPSKSPSAETSVLARFRNLLRYADLGIEDVRISKKEMDDFSKTRILGAKYELKHKFGSNDAWLPLEEESRGTQTLFRLAMPILGVMDIGNLMVVDELEASMHPILAQEIVRQFNDPKTNSSNAQLIFATHDTNLLGTLFGEPVLRRDQVWLTEKDPQGATVLYPLTDFKPRKAENVERGYVQGRYGAVPFLGDFDIAGGR